MPRAKIEYKEDESSKKMKVNERRRSKIHPVQMNVMCTEYGKSSNFSESFNNIMYEDNSLWAATRFKQRLTSGQEQRELKREREMAKMKSL